MLIEILGSGCPSCVKAYENVKKAVEEAGSDAEVEKVEDINVIIGRGIMMTPAVFIDGEKAFAGKIPSVQEVKEKLK